MQRGPSAQLAMPPPSPSARHPEGLGIRDEVPPVRKRPRCQQDSSTDTYIAINMGVSENRGPKCSTLNSRILIMRPKARYPYFRKLPHGTDGVI